MSNMEGEEVTKHFFSNLMNGSLPFGVSCNPVQSAVGGGSFKKISVRCTDVVEDACFLEGYVRESPNKKVSSLFVYKIWTGAEGDVKVTITLPESFIDNEGRVKTSHEETLPFKKKRVVKLQGTVRGIIPVCYHVYIYCAQEEPLFWDTLQ